MATQLSRAKQDSRGGTGLPEQYTIDFNRPLPGAGGGLPAFVVREDPASGIPLIAIQVRPEYPPLDGPLQKFVAGLKPLVIPGLMTPLAHGTYSNAKAGGQEGYYLICAAPPGPAVGDTGPAWSETELIDGLLRPVAVMLERLKALGMTHRGIRPDNLFRAGSGSSIMLGCAWATPPGLLQPALYEPPYSAICIPGGRGVGHIGDDIYALAMTMITLARGRPPLTGLDDAEIMRRKLDLGCHAAVTAEGRLPQIIIELTRGMLTEDPEHRPTPAMLTDPLAASGRRLAARPPRRALRPLDIGGMQVWNGRMVAYAIGLTPEIGAKMLRSGEIDQWLRRHVGDIGLAGRIDEVVRQRNLKEDGKPETTVLGPLDNKSDAMTAMRAAVAFDPLAPMTWRGVALWPDAIGPALAIANATAQSNGEAGDATAAANTLSRLEEIVSGELIGRWADLRPERCDVQVLRADARLHRNLMRQKGTSGGVARLSYSLNPMLRCGSPLLAAHFVTTINGLLAALEAISVRPEVRRGPPMDHQIASFIASRVDLPGTIEATAKLSPLAASLLPLRTLAALQARMHVPALPGLARWLVDSVPLAVEAFQSRSRRTQITEKLALLARKGDLTEIAKVLDDQKGRDADSAAFRRAMEEVARLDAQIANVGAAMEGRSEEARRLGQEICVGIGVVSVVVAVGLVVL